MYSTYFNLKTKSNRPICCRVHRPVRGVFVNLGCTGAFGSICVSGPIPHANLIKWFNKRPVAGSVFLARQVSGTHLISHGWRRSAAWAPRYCREKSSRVATNSRGLSDTRVTVERTAQQPHVRNNDEDEPCNKQPRDPQTITEANCVFSVDLCMSVDNRNERTK
jgi:hypothetical protein